jgi:DNA-binding NtrC family response regulator
LQIDHSGRWTEAIGVGSNLATYEAAGLPDLRLEPTLVLSFVHQGQCATQRRRIPADGLLLGRGEVVFDDVFDDPRMLSRHAEVRIEGNKPFVRDLGGNGDTRLNGEVMHGDRELDPGDVLRLGDTLLVYAPSAAVTIPPEPELVGASASMSAVRRSVDAVAAFKHTVVITGETGTGKEVVARLIHQRSGRRGPFLAINCGAIAEGLLTSDLFGHVRGAFTGAVVEQQGLFRAGRGGTILLDEVAEIPLGLQANLLRVLEMHEVRPLGSASEIAVDVRVIATSHSELVDLVQAGRFRADLYARLAQWTIRLPPLRMRREDIPALTTHLLARADARGRRLTPDLAEALLVHDWPLNVRGLFNVLSVAVIAVPGDQPLALGAEVVSALQTSQSMVAVSTEHTPPPVFDKAALEQVLLRFQGRVAASARHLGISRPKLYRLLWGQGIEPVRYRG